MLTRVVCSCGHNGGWVLVAQYHGTGRCWAFPGVLGEAISLQMAPGPVLPSSVVWLQPAGAKQRVVKCNWSHAPH
jgi:hypothetical protein